ncbi:sperm-associated antigen 1 [Eurosta solidaginis]|uniref:sperm-associated antigen 1 n=1 Tax=Eurosta solidaginis TaxID=178769 RepID=UPI0035308758
MDGIEGKKLVDKYEIPINHLDFAYIRECKNAREMEKIVQILRSGEEGFFPDLTKCAEDKLRELKPNSRLFRYEEQLRGREALSNQDWKPIYDWTNNIKVTDNKLSAAAEKMAPDLALPPIRKGGIIKKSSEEKETEKQNQTTKATKPLKTSCERIKSTDYNKWDKYDADVEVLRMELAEERVQEEVERKNLGNKQKSKLQEKGAGGDADSLKQRDVMSKLTEVERERLAEEYRLRGNDYFRAKEYENAVNEYNRSIAVCPEKAAPAYNNRAAANIKLKWYSEAIKDCELCLQMEPDNLKARLRLAEATCSDGLRKESYALYLKVLELDPQNAVALKATTELKNLFGELPPPTATRLQIKECSSTKKTKPNAKSNKEKKSIKTEKTINETKSSLSSPSCSATKPMDYDLADLIKPNRLVKNKLATAAAALSNMKSMKAPNQQQQKPIKCTSHAMKHPENISQIQNELKLRTNGVQHTGKLFIQEI